MAPLLVCSQASLLLFYDNTGMISGEKGWEEGKWCLAGDLEGAVQDTSRLLPSTPVPWPVAAGFS